MSNWTKQLNSDGTVNVLVDGMAYTNGVTEHEADLIIAEETANDKIHDFVDSQLSMLVLTVSQHFNVSIDRAKQYIRMEVESL